MRTTGALRWVSLGIGWVALCGVGACAAVQEAPSGVGFLDVGDLEPSAAAGYPSGRASPVRARLVVRANGCVTVLVDGVERVPLWPEGTSVAQHPVTPDRYTVALPTGLTLTVEAFSGDTFSALGVIDDDASADRWPEQSKIGSLVGFCGVPDAPIAFPDAGSFRRSVGGT